MPEPLMTGALVMSAVGSLISAFSQGSMSAAQLRVEMRKLGLQEEQMDFLIDQELRKNQIQSRNVARVNPLLTKMLGQAQSGANTQPYTRPPMPQINNPYSGGQGITPGGGAFPSGGGTPALSRPAGGAGGGMLPSQIMAQARAGGGGGVAGPLPQQSAISGAPNAAFRGMDPAMMQQMLRDPAMLARLAAR